MYRVKRNNLLHGDKILRKGDEIIPDSVPVPEGGTRTPRFTRAHIADMLRRGEIEEVPDAPKPA